MTWGNDSFSAGVVVPPAFVVACFVFFVQFFVSFVIRRGSSLSTLW